MEEKERVTSEWGGNGEWLHIEWKWRFGESNQVLKVGKCFLCEQGNLNLETRAGVSPVRGGAGGAHLPVRGDYHIIISGSHRRPCVVCQDGHVVCSTCFQLQTVRWSCGNSSTSLFSSLLLRSVLSVWNPWREEISWLRIYLPSYFLKTMLGMTRRNLKRKSSKYPPIYYLLFIYWQNF